VTRDDRSNQGRRGSGVEGSVGGDDLLPHTTHPLPTITRLDSHHTTTHTFTHKSATNHHQGTHQTYVWPLSQHLKPFVDTVVYRSKTTNQPDTFRVRSKRRQLCTRTNSTRFTYTCFLIGSWPYSFSINVSLSQQQRDKTGELAGQFFDSDVGDPVTVSEIDLCEAW
jgi:hypothetical protein